MPFHLGKRTFENDAPDKFEVKLCFRELLFVLGMEQSSSQGEKADFQFHERSILPSFFVWRSVDGEFFPVDFEIRFPVCSEKPGSFGKKVPDKYILHNFPIYADLNVSRTYFWFDSGEQYDSQ